MIEWQETSRLMLGHLGELTIFEAYKPTEEEPVWQLHSRISTSVFYPVKNNNMFPYYREMPPRYDSAYVKNVLNVQCNRWLGLSIDSFTAVFDFMQSNGVDVKSTVEGLGDADKVCASFVWLSSLEYRPFLNHPEKQDGWYKWNNGLKRWDYKFSFDDGYALWKDRDKEVSF